MSPSLNTPSPSPHRKTMSRIKHPSPFGSISLYVAGSVVVPASLTVVVTVMIKIAA